MLEGFRPTTENRGVPGSSPASPSLPLGETRRRRWSRTARRCAKKSPENRPESLTSFRATNCGVRARGKLPANAHKLPRDVARPRGFEPLTFGSVDRSSTSFATSPPHRLTAPPLLRGRLARSQQPWSAHGRTAPAGSGRRRSTGRSIGRPASIDHASRTNWPCVHASGVDERVALAGHFAGRRLVVPHLLGQHQPVVGGVGDRLQVRSALRPAISSYSPRSPVSSGHRRPRVWRPGCRRTGPSRRRWAARRSRRR